jgi:hypothetical protein
MYILAETMRVSGRIDWDVSQMRDLNSQRREYYRRPGYGVQEWHHIL